MESENGTATEGGSTETVKPKKIQTSSAKKKSTLGEKKGVGNSEKQMAENGQTLLDVSKGDIRITKNGAAGGGLTENETSLNEKGYWVTGTTTSNNIEVSEGVKTDITLDNVSITIGELDTTTSKWDCMNVSHADVTITLVGKNELLCNTGRSADGLIPNTGAAIAKDGMDGNLTIQCENADKKDHKCSDSCGFLLAQGNRNRWHVGAIGSTLRNVKDKKNCGFANFTIKGGNIEASAGWHTPGIGAACITEASNPGCFTKKYFYYRRKYQSNGNFERCRYRFRIWRQSRRY